MNISKENVDAQIAVVTLSFDKADYEQKVDAALKSYRKKASMPGFRPGHVPAAMIKKMYGKAVLVEEVNKLVGETLMNYISENKLDILGEPLPSEGMEPIDFDKELDTIEFKFDLAIAPEVNLNLETLAAVPCYSIEITDKMVDDNMKNITSRFGKHETAETVSEQAMVKGNIAQEGAYSKESSVISVTVMKDDAEKAKFLGKKAGDIVSFDIKKAFPNDTEISYILGISKEEAAEVSGEYAFTIAEVTEFKDAELTQEIFDQVYGEGNVKSEEEFKAKTKETIAANNLMEEDYRFSLDVRNAIMAAVNIELPEAFLKRWLTAINRDNEKFTPEVLENEFPRFIEDLKWQVVKNNIIKNNDLKVEHEDLLAFAKKAARAQFLQYGLNNIPDEHLENYAVSMLKNEEQYRQISEGAVNEVVTTFVKGKVKLDSKSISRADFNKLFE